MGTFLRHLTQTSGIEHGIGEVTFYKIAIAGHVFLAILSKVNRVSLISIFNDCTKFEDNC